MVHGVGKGRGGLVAHAVDTEMPGGANHVSAAQVIAGLIQPLCFLPVLAIYKEQAAGLLVVCRFVSQSHGDASCAEVLNSRRRAVLPCIAYGKPVGGRVPTAASASPVRPVPWLQSK